MAKSREIKMPLPSAADLFSTQALRDEEKREFVQEISFAEISDFSNHPFKVRMVRMQMYLMGCRHILEFLELAGIL